ncbi:MAG: topoisomerase DNA-binding C4 zinc finger domain-containing protein, partial [Oscillospiraceae bacterium]
LDKVETGDIPWVDNMESFYKDFDETLKNAEKNMEGKRVKVPVEETDIICELCGRNMVIKMGRFGKFLACPGFPECKNTKKIVEETKGLCPVCGKKVITKKSKKGKTFYGCEGYPECNFMTWDKPLEEICPKCGKTLFRKMGRGALIHCLGENCDFTKPVAKKGEEDDN